MNRPIHAILLIALATTPCWSQQEAAQGEPNLRQLAREAYAEALPGKAREHLRAALDLHRQHFAANRIDNAYAWSRRLSEVAREHLRNDRLTEAMNTLGEAADLNLPLDESIDDGLASAAAGLHRHLAALGAEERFELLRAWSLPTDSRRTVRVLTTITPTIAPPDVFARALGERPRRDSFPVPEVGDVQGLFSTAWELVKAADDTGSLRGLTAELTRLVDDDVPNARIALLLARIAGARRPDQQLLDELTAYAQALADWSASTRLATPLEQRVWQFGSGRFDGTAERTADFKAFPHWHSTRGAWCGGSSFPKTSTGWSLVNKMGGSPGADYPAIRRWIAPFRGTATIAGELARANENGNGIRGRVVSSRLGQRGIWTIQSGSIATGVESIQVESGDTIDFVVESIDRDANFDQFLWTVQVDLQSSDGEKMTFDSTTGFHGPLESNVDLALAAACLTRDWLQVIGEGLFKTKLEQTYERESRLMRPFLRCALATAIRKRFPDTSLDVGRGSDLELWVPSSGQEAARNAQGAARSVWLTHEDHTMHLAGPRSDYLFFKYPLVGEFEFSCEAQIGGPAGTDGCVGYGGLGYELWGAQQLFKVWTVSHHQVAQFEVPFVANNSLATFNRFSLKSTDAGVTLSCNGHPTWTDTANFTSSPWIALRSYGSSAPVFRKIELAGDPVIPREVSLSDGDSLRGWVASYYGERIGNEDSDWFVQDGVVHGKRADTALSNPQSRLYYLRPLLNGESISYEFQYEPGRIEVHPALGQIAFLIEPDGVQLHWMTDGDREWSGLAEDNAVVEPLNRRGPKPLPMALGEWNRASLALDSDTLTLSLNDTIIYIRKMDPDNERTFGFYHDKNQREARVRNVVMRGDWPEKLTPKQLGNLAAANADRSSGNRQALGEIFEDRHIHGSVLEVHVRAAAMPAEQRYKFLSDWVLPNEDHATLRMVLDFTPANPAPVLAATGGELVAPALSLVAVAKELNRLDDLKVRVESLSSTNDQQQRARLSMLALIAMTRGEFATANQHLEQLAALVVAGRHTSFLDRGPETLAIVGAAEIPETRDVAREMALHILTTQIRKQQPSGSQAWDQHLDSLSNRLQLLASSAENQHPAASAPLTNWHPVSHATARTRGQGLPQASWQTDGTAIHKLSGHAQDYLYYQVPLRGNYEVECDLTSTAWQTMELMVAGNWVGPWWNRQGYVFGNFRQQQPLEQLALPLAGQKNQWARYRAVVRDGACTTYFNGRKLHEQILSDDCEPWLAIRATALSHGAVRDLRISGDPVIPEQISLATTPELAGWFSYYDDPVGPDGDWRSEEAGQGIIGRAKMEFKGSHQEALLRYHRPLIEDGVVEYDFYYRAGEIDVHPALDRLAFMLHSDGVSVHRITDGPFERTGLAPDNLQNEPDNGRREGALPLKQDAWNRLQLSLTGDVVDLRLNGEVIYRHEIEPSNDRTFGLFNYADRTEARVRNIVWRGGWPRELPPIEKQELAHNQTDFLDDSLAELDAKFHHDFSEHGLPSKLFGITSGRREDFDAQADGLRVTREGSAGYDDSSIGPLLTMDGDFDVIASFEQLDAKPAKDGSAGIYLSAAVDSDESTRALLLLRHFWDSHRSRPVIQPAYNDRKIGGVRRDRFLAEATEAAAGRLRLARRGEAVYYLFAENDSPHFRLLETQTVATDEPVHVRLVTETHREGTSTVVWKDLTIRANKLAGLALKDQEELMAGLDQQRDALPHRFDQDFANDPLTADRFAQWGPVPLQGEEKGVRLVRPGADNWSSAGIAPLLGLIGDFDISATIKELKLGEPKAGRTSEFHLRVMCSDESQTQAFINFVEKADSGPQIFAQIRALDAGGNQLYRRVRLDRLDAVESLRLARRGKQMSFIYRAVGSDRDQILAQVDVDAGPIAARSVRLELHTGGVGRQSEVLLKTFRAHAEKFDPMPSAARGDLLEALAKQLTGDLPANALEFDGQTQYVSVPSLRYDGSHPITLEAFVTTDDLRNVVIGDTQNAGIGLGIPNGQYNLHAWNGTAYDAAVADGAASKFLRIHLAGTFDGQTLQVFVDGKRMNTAPLTGPFKSSRFTLTIGGSPSPREPGIDYAFQGVIDQVRVSKAVRYTQAFEVPRQLEPDESTIALYRFDEGEGTKLGDSSGNNHHGKLRGARWVTGEAIRRRAALGLAEYGRRGVPLLTEALLHDDAEVQLAAIAALETLGGNAQATVPELKRLTTDRDPRIRRAAERAVTLIEAGGAIKGILDLFKSTR